MGFDRLGWEPVRHGGPGGGHHSPGRPEASAHQARTLVLHGGTDTVVDPRNGKLLADRIPGARLISFPKLGHLLFWEDPDGFADAVTSFLLTETAAGQPARTHGLDSRDLRPLPRLRQRQRIRHTR